jgi:peptide/nickel transport system permease protein
MLDQNPRLKEFKYTLHRIFRNPSAVIGFSLLFFFILVALLAPYIAPPKHPDNPYLMPHYGYSSVPSPPGKENIFGTTSGQYDIFYGIIWGTRTAFKIGLFVAGTGAVIGIILGLIAGYYGGFVDELLMRATDIIFAIPILVLTMAIVVAFGRGLDKVMIALALVNWRNYIRVMRSGILSLRELDFVHAAKLMGVSNLKIMYRHILPNSIHSVIVLASMDIGSLVIIAAFMSFIGLGAPKGYADWGQMVALARDYILGPPGEPLKYWYTVVIPGSAIVLFVLSWNLIGDALRDAFDPKIRRR